MIFLLKHSARIGSILVGTTLACSGALAQTTERPDLQGICTHAVKKGSAIHLLGNLKGNSHGEVGLNGSGNHLHIRALRVETHMNRRSP